MTGAPVPVALAPTALSPPEPPPHDATSAATLINASEDLIFRVDNKAILGSPFKRSCSMNIICNSSDQMQIGHHSWLVGSCHIHQIPGVSARFLPPFRSMFREPPLAMTKPYIWRIFAGPGTSDENPDYPDMKCTKFFLRQTCWKAEMGNFGFESRHIRSDLKQAFNRKF